MENLNEKNERMEVRELPAQPEDGPHVATYTRNKKTGGYNVRVTGPKASLFTGQEVPVSTKDGKEHIEKSEGLRFCGPWRLW